MAWPDQVEEFELFELQDHEDCPRETMPSLIDAWDEHELPDVHGLVAVQEQALDVSWLAPILASAQTLHMLWRERPGFTISKRVGDALQLDVAPRAFVIMQVPRELWNRALTLIEDPLLSRAVWAVDLNPTAPNISTLRELIGRSVSYQAYVRLLTTEVGAVIRTQPRVADYTPVIVHSQTNPLPAIKRALAELQVPAQHVREVSELPGAETVPSCHPHQGHLCLDDAPIVDEAAVLQSAPFRSISMLGCKMEHLRWLDALTDTRQLRLGRLPFDGVDELKRGARLEVLEIQGCRLPNLDFLDDLPLLRRLSIDRLAGADAALRAVARHPVLRELSLSEPGLTDLRGLRGSTLRILELWQGALSCLDGLGRQPRLRTIRLRGTSVRDVGGLEACEALTTLDLAGCPVSDIAPLAGSSIRELHIERTDVRDLEPLLAMEELKAVTISDWMKPPKSLSHRVLMSVL